jgi:hypothetical protein
MNKTLKILLACIAIMIILIGYILYSNNSADKIEVPIEDSEIATSFPGSTESVGNQDFAQIREQVVDSTSSSFTALQMGETYIYKNYAFQVWFDEDVGGEALLRWNGSVWELVSLGGGAWEDYTLVSLGVPQETATYMVNNRPY